MSDKQLLIDPDEVYRVFRECSVKLPTDQGAIMVEGMESNYHLVKDEVEKHRLKITEWLRALPATFRANDGGGWSLLRGCLQQDGRQWTGFQERVEQLFCLGMALGLVEYFAPREVWSTLPGAVPYYIVLVD